MPERIRVMCPVCGMMPFLENLEQTTVEKPAKVRVFVLRFGGKVPGQPPLVEGEFKKKKRGSAPGKMENVEITDKVPDQVKQFEAWFDDRIKQYQEGKGK